MSIRQKKLVLMVNNIRTVIIAANDRTIICGLLLFVVVVLDLFLFYYFFFFGGGSRFTISSNYLIYLKDPNEIYLKLRSKVTYDGTLNYIVYYFPPPVFLGKFEVAFRYLLI